MQQLANAIFVLENGEEVRVSLEEPLSQLRGDQQPALAGAPEPQAGGRLLRLVFACGSDPCVVTPPEGWDGRPPTLARRSVEWGRAGGLVGGRASHGLGPADGLAVQMLVGGQWGALLADGLTLNVGAWREAQTTNQAALILAAINEKWRLECNPFGDPLGWSWWRHEIQRTGYENGLVDAPALIGKSGRVRIAPRGRAPRVPAAPPPSRPAPRTAPAGGGRLASETLKRQGPPQSDLPPPPRPQAAGTGLLPRLPQRQPLQPLEPQPPRRPPPPAAAAAAPEPVTWAPSPSQDRGRGRGRVRVRCLLGLGLVRVRVRG